jgi:hypothetical protein
MVVLGCDSMDCVLHDESSQAGRMKTTRSGLGDVVHEVGACKTALRMSSGSYSGLAMHDPVSRYLNELKWAPKLASSGNAVQYSTFGCMELFNGLAKSSKVVLKHAWIAEARLCVMAH